MPAVRKKASPKGLIDLLEHGLKDIYYAEKKIYKTLPRIIKAASDDELKDGLTAHREETAVQISRLEEVFAIIGKKPQAVKCEAIDGILKEGDELLQDFGKTRAGDAAIVFSCQAVEHYEITRYGSMQTYAAELGHRDIAKRLGETLAEEQNADKTLSKVAVGRVNFAAEEETPAAAK